MSRTTQTARSVVFRIILYFYHVHTDDGHGLTISLRTGSNKLSCRVLTCFIRVHCLHRKFIHARLHDRLVETAATGCYALWPQESLDVVVLLPLLLLRMELMVLMGVVIVATRCRLGHRGHCARGQRGRGGARRGLVNRVTGSGRGEKMLEINTLEFIINRN